MGLGGAIRVPRRVYFYFLLRVVSKIVAAQFVYVRDGDFSPFHSNQPGFREFVQDAGEVFLGEVEARGDGAFAGGKGDGQRARVGFRVFAQQIANDALPAGVQRIGLDIGNQVVQADRQ